ncbi:hypothetical protein CerSpe_201030 [Prunus speciosa]
MQEEREIAGNASENEESDEEVDTEFIDSDYEQDTDAEEVEVDDTMFEECIDNPIEEEPEEMGYAEISDDVQNSEDLHSKQDNDDECDENGEVTSNKRKRNVPNFRQWRREAMLKNPTFDIGMHFANKTVFKEAVQHYTCMVGKNIWFKKDDKQRVRVACEVGCPFVIFSSRIDDSPTMVIKTLNLEHECSRDQRNYWLNSTFFAQRYANELRAYPDWSPPSAQVVPKPRQRKPKLKVARGGRKMQQSRSNSNALAGTSISQPSLAVIRFSQPSPAPQVASQLPTAHNCSSQQASTSQTVQRRKLKSPAKKGRPWRV